MVSGLVPNRKSTPLVYEWVGVEFRGERFASLMTFDDVVERTGLGGGSSIANRGQPVDGRGLGAAAAGRGRGGTTSHRRTPQRFEDVINAKLDEELNALEQLRGRRFAQLELKLEQSTQPATHKTHREDRARRDIDEGFNRLPGMDSGNHDHGKDAVAEGHLCDGGRRNDGRDGFGGHHTESCGLGRRFPSLTIP